MNSFDGGRYGSIASPGAACSAAGSVTPMAVVLAAAAPGSGVGNPGGPGVTVAVECAIPWVERTADDDVVTVMAAWSAALRAASVVGGRTNVRVIVGKTVGDATCNAAVGTVWSAALSAAKGGGGRMCVRVIVGETVVGATVNAAEVTV